MVLVEVNPIKSPILGGRVFTADLGQIQCLVSKDYGKWHMSISHASRYPTWDEIKQAVYELLPEGLTYAMYFPPKSQFVNIHPNCFHVYESEVSDDRPSPKV